MRNLVFLGLFVLSWAACKEEVAYQKAYYAPLTEAVYASAKVQPADLYEAYASVNGIVEQRYVEVGDTVQKGELLFSIRGEALHYQAQTARLNWELAQERFSGQAAVLEELQLEADNLQLKLAQDSVNYFRQKRLWEQQIGSQQQLDTRKLAYESSQKQLAALQKRYQRTRIELRKQAQQAERQYRASNSNVEDFKVYSQANGQIYELYRKVGELVVAQQPLAVIGSAQEYLLELEVDEVDITRLRIGQQVWLQLDAYADTVFEAKISDIAPQLHPRSQTFLVEARFVRPPARLYRGLSGEANIVIRQKDKVLVLPRRYVSEKGFVETESGLVKVSTGLKSIDLVEITGGIDTTTKVLQLQGS